MQLVGHLRLSFLRLQASRRMVPRRASEVETGVLSLARMLQHGNPMRQQGEIGVPSLARRVTMAYEASYFMPQQVFSWPVRIRLQSLVVAAG